MTKAEIRKLYSVKRQELSHSDLLKLDDLLLIQFQKMSFPGVELLLSYMPMQHKTEPNATLYTRYFFHMNPGVHIAYPVTDFRNLSMQAFVVNEDTAFIETKQGIAEPVDALLVEPEAIDMVFVPFLACDKKGYRVGYGKGFYDRFLKECRPDIIKLGFSYFDPVEEISDVEPFDVPLDYCITPQAVFKF